MKRRTTHRATPASLAVRPQAPLLPRRPLSESDAIDIWIARWLKVQPKELIQRYQCDPRRLYEIWEETHFIGSRRKALEAFAKRYPTLHDRFDSGPHRRVASRTPHPDQLCLFPQT